MQLRFASKLSTALVVIMVIGGLIMGYAITQSGTRLLMDAATSRLSQESKIVAIRLQDIVGGLQRDIEFLQHSPALKRVVDQETPGSGKNQALAHLAEVFSAMMNSHPWYVQTRLIGLADGGREVVRVDRINGRIQRIPNDELQAKGERNYYKEAMNLSSGNVYLSPINLNREHGEMSEPHQAMLRVALRVMKANGKPYGIVVINIDAQRVFEAMRDVVSPMVTMYVANQDGFYLYHPDPEKTFGFDLARPFRIGDDFPEAQKLQSGTTKEIIGEAEPRNPGEAVMVHLSVQPLLPESGRVLLLGLSIPRSAIVEEVNSARRKSVALILPFLLVGSILVIWMVRIFIAPLERVTRAMGHFSPGTRRQRLLEENRRDEIGLLAQTYSRMAERIERQVSELKEQRKRFQSLFETAADAVLIIDQDGTIEYCNGATERLFGYEEHELIAQDVKMLMPDPDRGHHREYMRRYLEGGEPHIIGIGREVTGVSKKGKPLQLHLSIGEFTLDGRRKFTGILHDISSDKNILQG